MHIIRMKFVLHCTLRLLKAQNPELKPGNNVFLFLGFVLSKVQKSNNIFNNIVYVRQTRIVLFVLFAKLGMRRKNFCQDLLVSIIKWQPLYSTSGLSYDKNKTLCIISMEINTCTAKELCFCKAAGALDGRHACPAC